MRQVGVLAAAGLYALDHNLPKLGRDHEIARRIANLFNSSGQGHFRVDDKQKTSNLVFVDIDPKVINAADLLRRIEMVSSQISIHLKDLIKKCDLSIFPLIILEI